MIPDFECKESWDAVDKALKTGVVKKSELPEGVLEDLKGYDKAVFHCYGKHPFVFVDNSKDQNKK